MLQFGSSLGINYGQVANNLPSPTEVVSILCSLQVTKTRIYDTNPQVLTAFANSSIELIVTVPNDQVASMMNPSQSLQWISTNVKPYLPATRITGKYYLYPKMFFRPVTHTHFSARINLHDLNVLLFLYNRIFINKLF